MLFVRNRLNRPCGTVAHLVTTKQLSGHGMLVHVGVEVKNGSAVLMRLTSGECRVVPILSLDDDTIAALDTARRPQRDADCEAEVQWPRMHSYEFDWSDCPREVEPRETDTFHFDFVVNSDLTWFETYSYIQNVTKDRHDIGWSTTTFHQVEE